MKAIRYAFMITDISNFTFISIARLRSVSNLRSHTDLRSVIFPSGTLRLSWSSWIISIKDGLRFMNKVEVPASVVSCNPYFYKEGSNKGEVKGFILDVLTYSLSDDDRLTVYHSQYFPDIEVLPEDLGLELGFLDPVNLILEVVALDRKPRLVSISRNSKGLTEHTFSLPY